MTPMSKRVGKKCGVCGARQEYGYMHWRIQNHRRALRELQAAYNDLFGAFVANIERNRGKDDEIERWRTRDKHAREGER